MKLKSLATTLFLAASLSACAPQAIKSEERSASASQQMNTNILPGDNFYEYACGNWIENLPYKPEYARYNQFDVLQEGVDAQIKQIIENCTNSKFPEGSIEKKIGDYYSLYMDTTRRNNEGMAPLAPYLEMVDQANSREQLASVSAHLYSIGITNVFFNILVDADSKDAANNIVVMHQGGLNLPSKDYYISNDSSTLKIRNTYKEYISNLFVLCGISESEASTNASNALFIENRIAAKNSSNTELRDIQANYHKTKFSDLNKLYPGINWNNYFKTIGYPEIEFVDVNQPAAIKNVAEILGKEDVSKIKSYLKFKIIATGASALSKEFVAENFRINQALNGAKADKSTSKKAIDDINSKFNMAVGELYVKKFFPEESKKAVLELVDNLKSELRCMIEELKWMSDNTKAKAIEKLDAFYVKIGYPNKWRDYSSLVIDPKKSLFENNRNISRYLLAYKLGKVNKPVDRDEWIMSPQTINAYYNPNTNEITFPAAILQPPFFDSKANLACNYGGIGCVIGHEMTHGFDDQGSGFDKNGNFTNWWTDADKKEFDKRAKVMEEYFNKQEVLPGEFANGKLTLGENIADNGGIKVAFRALMKKVGNSMEKDGEGFTPAQRFYINYAFIWAGKINNEEMLRRIKSDPHSAMKHRVNCQLPHQQSWYDAFGITEDSPMYIAPENRVDIW